MESSNFETDAQKAPRIEEWALVTLGYQEFLDTVVKTSEDGTPIFGKNFLDAYGNSPHRTDTENLLIGLKDMDPEEEDYKDVEDYIKTFLDTYFKLRES